MPSALALMVLVAGFQAQPATNPVTIQPGDTVRVDIYGQGDPNTFTVLPDGSISGTPYGRVVISGKTVEQAANLIRDRAKKYIKDPVVFVTIVLRRPGYVYLVGSKAPNSRIEWTDNLDLRSVAYVAEVNVQLDQLVARVFRDGEELGSIRLDRLLSGKELTFNPQLKPDDVVSIISADQVRVWILNSFMKPGEYMLPVGSNLAQAIAHGGGALFDPPEGVVVSDPEFRAQSKIRVTRGGKNYDFSPEDIPALEAFEVQSGDTLSVFKPNLAKLTITGHVNVPGQQTVLEGTPLLSVIGNGGGADETGTLRDVLVLRNQEVFRVDLSNIKQGEPAEPFPVRNGDFIVIQENVQTVISLGEIARPGKYLIKDGESLTLADLVSKSGGLTEKGTFRRVMLARANEEGKFEVKTYNLDEFLKDGKLEANPTLQPGDFVMFSPSRGITANTFLQLLPTAALIGSVFR
ncbi:MAG: SLBB domain-containing protein [Armatimonadetes bacterium]|nr:SLBB domain-containing protein [Armatimonadota bacterium]